MSAEIIDGKKISALIKEKVKQEVDYLKKSGIHPGLAVILVGTDPASQIYVNNKEKGCQLVGINSEIIRYDKDVTEAEVLTKIKQLNEDKSIHGILVQSPVPKHIDEEKITLAISPEKDVDCFHPMNVGNLYLGNFTPFQPCTPQGVMELLKAYKVELAGKTAVVIGRSNIVGKPMAALLLKESCTVTIAHSKTKNLPELCKTADILVSAIGKAKFVTADFVKPGAVVIDVGMNRTEEGLFGDVDFDAVKEIAGKITPVPGGVGVMTIAMLLNNCVQGAKTLNFRG